MAFDLSEGIRWVFSTFPEFRKRGSVSEGAVDAQIPTGLIVTRPSNNSYGDRLKLDSTMETVRAARFREDERPFGTGEPRKLRGEG